MGAVVRRDQFDCGDWSAGSDGRRVFGVAPVIYSGSSPAMIRSAVSR